MQQWLLARPEMREFLARPRRWCPTRSRGWSSVDTMKKLQGWTDVTVTHFRDLAVFGEQIPALHPLRRLERDHRPGPQSNWARYWRRRFRATSTPIGP